MSLNNAFLGGGKLHLVSSLALYSKSVPPSSEF